MASRFDFDLNGVEGYTRRLRGIADRAGDSRTLFRQLIDIFKRSEKRIFDTGGRALGAKWAPLSPAYAAFKRRNYPGKPILQRTGRLRASLVERPVVRFRGNTMSVGTNVPYSRYHQNGEGNNPRRRHVGLTFGDRQAWRRAAAQHIATGRRLAGEA